MPGLGAAAARAPILDVARLVRPFRVLLIYPAQVAAQLVVVAQMHLLEAVVGPVALVHLDPGVVLQADLVRAEMHLARGAGGVACLREHVWQRDLILGQGGAVAEAAVAARVAAGDHSHA